MGAAHMRFLGEHADLPWSSFLALLGEIQAEIDAEFLHAPKVAAWDAANVALRTAPLWFCRRGLRTVRVEVHGTQSEQIAVRAYLNMLDIPDDLVQRRIWLQAGLPRPVRKPARLQAFPDIPRRVSAPLQKYGLGDRDRQALLERACLTRLTQEIRTLFDPDDRDAEVTILAGPRLLIEATASRGVVVEEVDELLDGMSSRWFAQGSPGIQITTKGVRYL